MHAINRTKEVVIISVARMEIKPFAPASMDMNWKRMVNPVYSVSGTRCHYFRTELNVLPMYLH